jgi:hypothetical protein
MKELYEQIPGEYEYVYMTIQPSDDMYAFDAYSTIQSQTSPLVGWKQGYILNCATKEIAEYNPTTIPPFFTIRFPKSIFFDAYKHAMYTGPYKSHEYIADKLGYVELPGRGFCVGTHGENISTVFNHIFKGRVVDPVTQNLFGIQDSEGIRFRKSIRLRVRETINLFPPPIQKKLKYVYYNVLKL